MSALLLTLGGLAVAAALYDGLKTTLSAQGGAPLTSALSAGLWAVLGRGPAGSRSRRAAGGTILTVVPLAWTVLLWLGWTLVFSSADGAVLEASSQTAADLPARVYFVGYTLFTLGNGDYVPHGATWQVLTTVASFTGLFLVTLAISYLLPVVQAVAQKRALARRIHSLGRTGAEIARTAPRSGSSLDRQIESIANDLTQHGERHLVYPVVHYFESGGERPALGPALAAADDALLLMRHALPSDDRPDPAALGSLETALDGYLDIVSGMLVSPSDESLPPPPTAGLPPLAPDAQDALARASQARERQRSLLHAIVRRSGYTWPLAS